MSKIKVRKHLRKKRFGRTKVRKHKRKVKSVTHEDMLKMFSNPNAEIQFLKTKPPKVKDRFGGESCIVCGTEKVCGMGGSEPFCPSEHKIFSPQPISKGLLSDVEPKYFGETKEFEKAISDEPISMVKRVNKL
jgi:hypothetical protein